MSNNLIKPNMCLLKDERLPKDKNLQIHIFQEFGDAVRDALRTATASHPWAFMSTDPGSGQLMSMLLKMTNAKKTIKIGVYTGYSLLATALALPDDGQIMAIDPMKETYEIGLPFIKKAGVEHKINYIQSEALPILDNLLQDEANEGSFDFAYVDADKDNYKNYFKRLMKLVKVGGLILYDNTLWGGTVAAPEEEVPEGKRISWRHIVEFNDTTVADPRVELCLLCSSDGLTIFRRIA